MWRTYAQKVEKPRINWNRSNFCDLYFWDQNILSKSVMDVQIYCDGHTALNLSKWYSVRLQNVFKWKVSKNKQGTQNNTNSGFWKEKSWMAIQSKFLEWKLFNFSDPCLSVFFDWYSNSCRPKCALQVAQQWCNFEYIDHLLTKFVFANKLSIHSK